MTHFSLTRHHNGTTLVQNRRSGFCGLYSNDGQYIHGDLVLTDYETASVFPRDRKAVFEVEWTPEELARVLGHLI